MTVPNSADESYMDLCLAVARQGQDIGEVPIGAIVVFENQIIASAHNETIIACDPSAHAEVVAIRRASAKIGNHRLGRCGLYVSLEPCMMCFGAMIQARIGELVYACDDERFGAFSGKYSPWDCQRHNHRFPVRRGILSQAASSLIKEFFQQRRHQAKS